MKMPTMKIPDMKINKSWNGLPSDYKVFIIVATLFFLLTPGIVLNIDEPSDLVKIISPGLDPNDMKIKSLLQIIWNYLRFDFKANNKKHEKTLKGMRPVLVHSIVAGLLATYLLKV